jgi:hypothetical protein
LWRKFTGDLSIFFENPAAWPLVPAIPAFFTRLPLFKGRKAWYNGVDISSEGG